jgi:hypothetical protein
MAAQLAEAVDQFGDWPLSRPWGPPSPKLAEGCVVQGTPPGQHRPAVTLALASLMVWTRMWDGLSPCERVHLTGASGYHQATEKVPLRRQKPRLCAPKDRASTYIQCTSSTHRKAKFACQVRDNSSGSRASSRPQLLDSVSEMRQRLRSSVEPGVAHYFHTAFRLPKSAKYGVMTS